MTKPTVSLRGMLAASLLVVASPLATAQFDAGLVSYWPLDANLLDARPTGAHGTFVPGSGDMTERYAPAQFGNGIDLNNFDAGSFDQWVDITGVPENTFDFAGGSMSISLWASTPFLSLDNMTLASKGLGSTWSLQRDGANLSVAMVGGGFSAADDPLADPFSDLEMHHIVGVVDGGVSISVYVDGQLVGTTSGNVQLGDSASNLTIGANPEADLDLFRTWEGVIDDVAVWSRPLSAGEVATIYNNGIGVSIADILNPVDSDGDGMPDFYENTNGLDPDVNDADDDADNDGRTNFQEYQDGTNPQAADTDGDGLDDGEEAAAGTNPNSPDSDGDSLTDGEEINGTQNPFLGGTPRDPFDPQSDPAGDPTSPINADTDGDGFDDKTEIDFKSDPNDAGDAPSPWQIGLKGYWKLNHADWIASDPDPTLRTFEDASGRGFTGILAGTDTTTLNSFAGPFGENVVRFNGVDQRIEITGEPDEFAMAGGDITVSAWFLTPGWGKSWQAVVAKGEGNNWRVHRNGGNPNLAYAGGRADISGGPAVADFAWHHVAAISRNGIGTELYVDGQLVATGPDSNLAANGKAMMIGANPDTPGDGQRSLFGAVTDVAVWCRPLSATEIEAIWGNYNGSSGGVTIEELIDGLDTDDDGMPDYYESANGLDINVDDSGEDPDGDGLTNLEEFEYGTDPQVGDGDGDGLNDLEEKNAGTDPRNADTDTDAVNDGDELSGATNPFLGGVLRDPFNPNSDPPGDPTDPLNADSDGDGRTDGAEIFALFDPNDPSSFPALPVVLYYTFDAADPSTVENFGSLATPGTVSGGVTYVDSIRPELGQAFMGNRIGSNDAYIDTNFTGTLLGFAGQDYTATALIRWGGTSGGEDHMIFAQTRTNNALHHGIRANGGGTNDGHFGHWGNDVGDAGTFIPGQWQHVAYSYKDGLGSVHIDGILVKSGNVGALNATGAGENIVIGYTGRDGAGTHGSFNGAIDEVKVFGRALDDTEILGEALRVLTGAEPLSVVLTNVDYNGPALEVTAANMDPAKSYLLRRTLDGQNFTDIGAVFTGGDINTFADPSPPAGTALYQIWEVAGP